MSLTSLEFSIIIPTYNRPESLRQCLQSITQIDYPCDCFEVIVVDDGSTVSLDKVIAPFQATITLKLITQSNAGPGKARNTGAKAAKGIILAFTDDDCQPASNWLRALASYFRGDVQLAGLPMAIGGHTQNLLTQNVYSQASQSLVDYIYEQYNPDLENAGFFTSNNLAVLSAGFHSINGFKETFPLAAAEDREFCDRWKAKGYRLMYAREALVGHAHKLTLRSFWQQQFNYGRGAFHFYQHSTQRHPWTFYLNLLRYPFRQKSHLVALTMAFLFLMSQIAVATGLLFESIQDQQGKLNRYPDYS